jgi:starch synthase (maltosyl-transferring)
MQRLILATTLAASYGIYGPAYELAENLPAKPVSEEYLNSEKYQVRAWNRAAAHSLAPLVTRLNQIRRTNPALQSDLSLHFHEVDNPQILCYSKSTLKPAPQNGAPLAAPAPTPPPGPTGAQPENIILVAVNLDPHNEQAGWIDLDLKHLGIAHDETFDVEDLLTGARYQWHDRSNYVALRPATMPAHILRVTRTK